MTALVTLSSRYQTRTNESSELEAAKVPLGSTATETAPRVCPGSERRGSTVEEEDGSSPPPSVAVAAAAASEEELAPPERSTLQTLTVSSTEPVTSSEDSPLLLGAQAQHQTASSWASSTLRVRVRRIFFLR